MSTPIYTAVFTFQEIIFIIFLNFDIILLFMDWFLLCERERKRWKKNREKFRRTNTVRTNNIPEHNRLGLVTLPKSESVFRSVHWGWAEEKGRKQSMDYLQREHYHTVGVLGETFQCEQWVIGLDHHVGHFIQVRKDRVRLYQLLGKSADKKDANVISVVMLIRFVHVNVHEIKKNICMIKE